jgi:hypothetical protein
MPGFFTTSSGTGASLRITSPALNGLRDGPQYACVRLTACVCVCRRVCATCPLCVRMCARLPSGGNAAVYCEQQYTNERGLAVQPSYCGCTLKARGVSTRQ